MSTGSEQPAKIPTRALAWGSDLEREILHRIADDVRRRTGFRACAIEVLRGDRMLEFVAIADDWASESEWLGQASPLELMERTLACGRDVDRLTFIATEQHPADLLERMTPYAVVPGSAAQRVGRERDMLVARVRDDRGSLRGLVYLDDPLVGRRLTDDELREVSATLTLPLRSVLTAFEREALAHRERLAQAVAEAIRELSSEQGVQAFLDQAGPRLAVGLRADWLEVRMFRPMHPTPPGDRMPAAVYAVLDEVARRTWQSQAVLVVDAEGVWGDVGIDAGSRDVLTAALRELGGVALVCVPIGVPDEALGHLLVWRRIAHWTVGESRSAMVLGHDVGRAVELARTLERERELKDELGRVDERRTEVARTVARELQNPLGAVLSEIAELQGSALDERQQRWLDAMERGGRRLQHLLNGLSQLDAVDDAAAAWVGVDLGHLVVDAVEQQGAVAAARGVDLQARLDSGGAAVWGNYEAMRGVLNNLIDNAVKYSDAGGHVLVTVRRVDDDVVVTCRDEGIGIAPEEQEQLFGDFFRSARLEAQRRPGTGLGLAIVQRIVEGHGGHIEVESVLGEGSTFTVTLPAR